MIYCIGCGKDVEARLTSGKEIYPHRHDLYSLPFWKCDGCGNYVGCHHKAAHFRTRPLGNIPTYELRELRKQIHAIIDPIWRGKKCTRGAVYAKLSAALGYEYHTGEIKSADEARAVLQAAASLLGEFMAFPKTLDEMTQAGYKFLNHATCKGCGDEIEWWETPTGKKIPMNPMERGVSPSVAHWATCPEQDSFRKKD